MKRIILFLSILVSANILANQTVGIGIYSKNSVYKAKKQIGMLPIVNIQHKNFYLKGSNLGYVLYKEPDFKLSAIINPLGGHTDFSIKKSDFKKGYENIESRKTQFMGGLALDFKLDKTTIGHAEYVFGNKGSKGGLKINRIIGIDDRITFIPAISFNYFNSKYMNYYIGLDKKDVQNNNYIKNTYKGKDTIGGGINATIEIAATEQLSISLFTGIDYFDKKIKKSDLIDKNYSSYFGLGFRYSF